MNGKRILKILTLALFFSFFYSFSKFYFVENSNLHKDLELIIGESSKIPASWVGTEDVNRGTPILILAGHADSQGLAGAGTPGEAVDKLGLSPMDPEISDELFWNLKLQESIVRLGQKKGLNIRFYDPEIRNIENENDPRTNWSIGKKFAENG